MTRTGLTWAVLPVLLAAAGCSALKTTTTTALTPLAAETSTVRLVYRTNASRLGLALAGVTSATPISEFTKAALEIRHPHPEGRPGFAQVRCSFYPDLEDDTSGIIHTRPNQETWTMDIPDWHVAKLLTNLREDAFFKKSRVFDTKAFIHTEVNGESFGKRFKEVDDLDSMIVRIRQHGRCEGATPEPAVPGLSAPGFQATAGYASFATDRTGPSAVAPPRRLPAVETAVQPNAQGWQR